MQKDVTFSENEKTLIAYIKSDIDHHSAKRMREKIDAQLMRQKPSLLIIDFSEVGFMDSSGLGLILGRVERANQIHASVRVTGLSPTLMKLVRLGGIERVHNLTVTK